MASIAGPTAAAFYTIVHLRARNLRLIGAAARCNFAASAKITPTQSRRSLGWVAAPHVPPRLSTSFFLRLSPSRARARARSRSLEVTRDRAPGAGGHVPGCRYHEKRMSIARSHSSGKGEAAASADFTKLSPLYRPYAMEEKKKRQPRGCKSDGGVLPDGGDKD